MPRRRRNRSAEGRSEAVGGTTDLSLSFPHPRTPTDTTTQNHHPARSYEEVIEQGGRVADAMRAFRTLLGGSDMLAH